MSELGIETDPDKTDKLSIGKCFVMEKEVEFSDHIVSEFGIQTDPDKTDKVSTEKCFFNRRQ